MESIYSLVVVDVESGVDIKDDNFFTDIQTIVKNNEDGNLLLDTLTVLNQSKHFQLLRGYLQNNQCCCKPCSTPALALILLFVLPFIF